jgi:hypothetical protein
MKMTAFWDNAPCSLVEVDRRFRDAYCLHQCFPTRVPQNIVKGSARNQRKNSDVITTHCFLHQEVLASKTIGEDLKQVLVAVNMVSFIKQRPLKSRMFAKLSENMQKTM